MLLPFRNTHLKMRLVLAAWVLAGLIAGCTAVQTASSTSSTNQMEQAWLDQKITSYRIEVLVISSVWHAQSHQITVRNNQVESATAACIPAPTEAGKCHVDTFNAEDYTVPGLFRKAQSRLTGQQEDWTNITYDSTYRFPQEISYNDPKVIDGDWSWRVTSFEVLQ